MTNYFRQHIPDFVSGVKRQIFKFETLEELLDNDIVKRWRMHPFEEDKPSPPDYFHRYSLSDNRLMAELKDGKEWYVIGYIANPEGLDLPKWSYPNE